MGILAMVMWISLSTAVAVLIVSNVGLCRTQRDLSEENRLLLARAIKAEAAAVKAFRDRRGEADENRLRNALLDAQCKLERISEVTGFQCDEDLKVFWAGNNSVDLEGLDDCE